MEKHHMAVKSPSGEKWREQEIEKSPEFWGNFGWIVFVLIGLSLGFVLFGPEDGFTTNVYTEAISIVITVVIVNRLVIQREQNEARQRLARQAGSRVREIAVMAVDELRQRGWLEGPYGLLRYQNISGVNLAGAELSRADLYGTTLVGANLEKAHLFDANLTYSDLSGANLTEANLEQACLRKATLRQAKMIKAQLKDTYLINADLSSAQLPEAILSRANLRGAELRDANLYSSNMVEANLAETNLTSANLLGANLRRANLTGASLQGSNFFKALLEGAILPDGSKWTPETNMARFTDLNHPDFWNLHENNA
jgi:uncharacterized protein YjbI with pentapeptide repeats